MSIQELKQECINNITLQAEHSTNDLKFIKSEIDLLIEKIEKELLEQIPLSMKRSRRVIFNYFDKIK